LFISLVIFSTEGNYLMSAITPEIIQQHGLTAEEYAKVLEIMGREPSMTELGIFSVMWSEHCSYKSSRVHLGRLLTTGERVIVPPGENAGVVDIGDDWCVAFKVESHNHPSFIEPFQGAATGVGGILRDVFTMGARPIALMNSLRFGPLTDKKNGNRNKSILKGCVDGIAHYGNCFGTATVGGEVIFDESYSLNPLVNAFALGIVRKDQIFFGKAEGVDVSDDALEFCRRKGLTVQKGLAETLPYADETFDITTALDVVEHLDDDIAGLKEMFRVTKRGGYSLIFVPAFMWLMSLRTTAGVRSTSCIAICPLTTF